MLAASWRPIGTALAAGILCAVAGCSGGGSGVIGSTEEATVHGTVRIKGKPATRGTVTFDPANAARRSAPTATADVGKDGTYTVKTLVGENAVTFRSPETPKDPKLSYFMKKVDVRAGDNPVDLDIPPADR